MLCSGTLVSTTCPQLKALIKNWQSIINPMANTGSFIPRQTNQPAPRKKITRRVYVLNYVVYVLFFGTLFVTAALFIWEFQLNKTLDTQRSLLEAERNKFSQSQIERVRELDMQLNIVQTLLDNHTSVLQIFSALEDTTLQNVGFAGFRIYSAGSNKENGEVEVDTNTYTLSLYGGLDDFNTLVFQREVLKQNDLLKGATIKQVVYGAAEGFEGLEIEDTSRISYEISIPIAMSDIPFRGVDIMPVAEENDVAVASSSAPVDVTSSDTPAADTDTFDDTDTANDTGTDDELADDTNADGDNTSI